VHSFRTLLEELSTIVRSTCETRIASKSASTFQMTTLPTPAQQRAMTLLQSITVLAGEGASIDTTTANGRLIFAIFAGLAEFERELIVERTRAGLASARARGRHGGRPFKMTPAKLRLAQAAMGKPETKVAELCAELGITRQTLYRHVTPKGEIRRDGEKLLAQRAR
jgi:DNA invertase Pin-like site-specific DNA recombinase